LKCSPKCSTCEYEATECTGCPGVGIGRSTNLPDCECLDGYFDDGEVNCFPCAYPCANCEVEETNCLSC
jgi:proprotein convertase subtilisin/kexin type 5